MSAVRSCARGNLAAPPLPTSGRQGVGSFGRGTPPARRGVMAKPPEATAMAASGLATEGLSIHYALGLPASGGRHEWRPYGMRSSGPGRDSP